MIFIREYDLGYLPEYRNLLKDKYPVITGTSKTKLFRIYRSAYQLAII